MANMIFNLDLNKNNAINHIIFGRLTDGNLRKITVNITNEGEPVDLTDWVIRFEGVTGGHTKVFDVIGVHLLDAENGKFEYTFSKTAFSASGAYKSAYFAIEKDNMRETTNDIRIIVENVADLDAKDAETVVTELNKTITLINQKYDELNNRVDIYEDDIAELDDWLASRKAEIEDLIDLANSNFSEKLTEIQSKLDATNKEFSILKSDLESLQSAVNNQSATVSTKANQTDLDNLKTDVTSQGVAISTKAEQADLLITNQNVATAQTTANQAETDAQTAIAKATEAQANSLSLNGNAVSASKLATARKLGVNLQSPTYQNFNGTADVTNIGVSGVLPIASGGTGTNDGIINTIAYAYSADGTDRFTTVYPNENLFSNKNYPNNPKVQTPGVWSKVYDTNSEKSLSEKLIGYVGDVYFSFVLKNPEVIQTEPFMTQLMAFDSSGNRISQPMIGFSKNNLLNNKRVSAKFTLTNTENSVRVEFHIRTLAGSISQNTIVEFEDFKVELGYPTIYTPSPKDSYKDAYPSYVGYSNKVKTNKVASDYKWFPTIDSHTSNKNNPHAVTASQTGAYTKSEVATLISEAIKQSKLDANPIGSVVSNNSNSSSGYMTGIWENIGSAVIGSTTIYYWQRTA